MASYGRGLRGDPNPRVSFGDERHRLLLAILGPALIALTVGALAAWWLSRGMRIYGSGLFSAIGGLFLLMRRRSGSIEFVRNAQQIRVTLTSIVWRRHILVSVHDLEGLTIMP